MFPFSLFGKCLEEAAQGPKQKKAGSQTQLSHILVEPFVTLMTLNELFELLSLSFLPVEQRVYQMFLKIV